MSVALSWCCLVCILGLLKIFRFFFVAFVYCSLDRFIINLLFHLSIKYLAFLNNLLLTLTLTPCRVWIKRRFNTMNNVYVTKKLSGIWNQESWIIPAWPASWIQGYFFLKEVKKGDHCTMFLIFFHDLCCSVTDRGVWKKKKKKEHFWINVVLV